MKKKYLSVLGALILVVSLFACATMGPAPAQPVEVIHWDLQIAEELRHVIEFENPSTISPLLVGMALCAGFPEMIILLFHQIIEL